MPYGNERVLCCGGDKGGGDLQLMKKKKIKEKLTSVKEDGRLSELRTLWVLGGGTLYC